MDSSPKTRTHTDSTRIRFGSRVPLSLAVRLLVDPGTVARGTIRNASISGALIETALELPLHANLVVTLSIPDEPSPAARSLPACVVRIDAIGVGVEWRDIAGADILDLLGRAYDHPRMD